MVFQYKKYSNKYAKLFEGMKSKIIDEAGKGIDIEHIGSTAVPGLGGKGIIDVSIGIKKWSEADRVVAALKRIGFDHFHDIEDHSLFASTRSSCQESDYHIHISRIGTKRYNQTLAFRDFLRQHEEEARKYDRLKSDLFAKCGDNRKLYGELKKRYFIKLAEKYKELF